MAQKPGRGHGTPDQETAEARQEPKAQTRAASHIAAHLRAAYESVEREELPDRFRDLLARLAKEEGGATADAEEVGGGLAGMVQRRESGA